MTRRARAGTRMHGFTLLEVLVALVIVAFGMGAVLAALSGAAVNIGALREKTLAQWVALNRVADARLTLQAPQAGTTEGDVKGFGNGDWHWQQIVTSMQEIPGLQQITVSVRRIPGTASGSSSGGGTAKITSTTGASSTSGTAAGPWITTVIGFRGDALQAASGEVPGDWSGTDNTNISTTPNTGASTGTVPNPGTSSSGATPTTPVTPPTVPVSPGGSSSGGP
jgi:general secretion pathway protein I